MALETTRLLIQTTDVVPLLLDLVTARFYTMAGVLATTGISSVDGIIDVLLDGAIDPGTQYIVRLYRFGYSFSSPSSIYVISPPPGAGNNFKAYGTTSSSIPSDSRLCRAQGYLRDAHGDAWQGKIRFSLLKPDIVDGAILSREITISADTYGYFLVDLFRTGEYTAMIEGASGDERNVFVPDQPTIPIADLLYPIVISVTYSPVAPLALTVGGTLEVTPTVLASDGRTLAGAASQDLSWSVDDATIAYLTIGSDILTLQGLKAGSTTLRATRLDDTITRIPDTLTGETAVINVT